MGLSVHDTITTGKLSSTNRPDKLLIVLAMFLAYSESIVHFSSSFSGFSVSLTVDVFVIFQELGG